jgi:anti-sigma B factor antagonist
MSETTRGLGIHVDRQPGDAVVISVSGQIDLYTAPDFKMATTRAIDDGVNHLVIDLTETTFMDSTGFAVLLSARKRLDRLGGSIAIVSPDAGIKRLFDIAGLSTVFAIYDTRSDIPGER